MADGQGAGAFVSCAPRPAGRTPSGDGVVQHQGDPMLQVFRAAGASFALVAVLFVRTAAAAPLPTRAFMADPQYHTVKISPDGRYLGVITPHEGRDILVVINLADRKILSTFRLTGWYADVGRFEWVSPERIVLESSQQYDTYAGRYFSGELYATNADGTRKLALIGSSVNNQKLESAAATGAKSRNAVWFMLDELRDNEKEALVTARYFKPGSGRFYRPVAERIDVFTGRTRTEFKSPLEGGYLSTDGEGRVRIAQGVDEERQAEAVFVRRDPDGDAWTDASKLIQMFGDDAWVPGFAPDGRLYVVGSEGGATAGLYAVDLDSWTTEKLYHTPLADVDRVRWAFDRTRISIVETSEARANRKYLDPEEPHAKTLRMLDRAFEGADVSMTSRTYDDSRAVVFTSSDRNSGDYFLFDLKTRKAEHLFSRFPDLDPELIGPRRAFAMKARDGVELQGFVTVPAGSPGRKLPTIVLVHGGPHGIYDTHDFDAEAALYANHGYAVVQVNFRGSGGYGEAFEKSGYRKWGREMQDDVTDATRWAIEQGIADPSRICIAGASYGGYSALMGVIREPDLYRCAFAFVGVYDLGLMFGRGDIPESKWGRDFLVDALGTDPVDLAARSPVNGVSKIKAGLFIAHGGQDDRAHPEHFRLLRRALDEADKPYQWHFEEKEGHGYNDVENRIELYDKALAFFAQHLGAAPR